MKYLILDKQLYAYDGVTGFTVQFAEGQWKLADLSYAALLDEPNMQAITTAEAMQITNGVGPENFIESFINESTKEN